MLLHILKSWAPFRVDALGLVTLLGTAEVDRTVGRLCSSRLTEFLPFLGAYTVSNNQITHPIPGFTLYNITDGMLATDLAGWFCRWLLCQKIAFCTSTIRITDSPTTRRENIAYVSSATLGSIAVSILVVLPVLLGDWWGLANSASMILSIFVRYAVLEANRKAVDNATAQSKNTSDEMVKIFLTIPTGKVVTILTTRGIVINCLLTTPRPSNEKLYDFMRALGWLAFAAHVVTLGMASLFCQLLTLSIILPSTVLAAYRIGGNELRVGSRLHLDISQADGRDFRAAAYARLNLTEQETDSMVQWNLFPHRSNEKWWGTYLACINDTSGEIFKGWDTKLAQAYSDDTNYPKPETASPRIVTEVSVESVEPPRENHSHSC